MIEITEEQVQLEAGSIVEGTVSGITSFGAFVKLPGRVEGLIHISEIANEYVTNIENYVTLGATVKVKILGLNKKNKYDLSLKQVPENNAPRPDLPPRPPMAPMMRPPRQNRNKQDGPVNPFEDKISDFLKKAEEKQIDLKRNIQLKQGVKKRKRR